MSWLAASDRAAGWHSRPPLINTRCSSPTAGAECQQLTSSFSSAVKAVRQSWMEAGVPFRPSQERPPPLPSFASGRLQSGGAGGGDRRVGGRGGWEAEQRG